MARIDLEKLMADPRTDPRLTDYQRGKAEAKWCAAHDPEGLELLANFPYLGEVLTVEYARGFREFANAWLIVNQA